MCETQIWQGTLAASPVVAGSELVIGSVKCVVTGSNPPQGRLDRPLLPLNTFSIPARKNPRGETGLMASGVGQYAPAVTYMIITFLHKILRSHLNAWHMTVGDLNEHVSLL